MNPDEEIRKLKLQFELWKKEYKIRLRETKTKRHQLGHSEAVKKNHQKWGERIRSKLSCN